MKQLVTILLCILHVSLAFGGSDDSAKVFRNRKIVLGASSASIAAVGSTGLYYAWYKDYNSGSFHFFNDNSEWLQMDKIGHSTTTYIIGGAGYRACKWSGISDNKSILIGGTSGLAYMTIIEVLDGFSSGWGFSWGDMCANTIGTATFTGQQYFWKEQRIRFKYSFHQSNYWQYRPDLLGNSLGQQMLKDYNGQTYWLSCNISSFLNKESKFPKWLNVAFGYGANGMISGKDDYVIIQNNGNIIGNTRYRRFLFSLDVDFSRIKTRSKVLRAVFRTINFIKVPFPAIEFSNKKFRAHPFSY